MSIMQPPMKQKKKRLERWILWTTYEEGYHKHKYAKDLSIQLGDFDIFVANIINDKEMSSTTAHRAQDQWLLHMLSILNINL